MIVWNIEGFHHQVLEDQNLWEKLSSFKATFHRNKTKISPQISGYHCIMASLNLQFYPSLIKFKWNQFQFFSAFGTSRLLCELIIMFITLYM